MHPVKQKKPNTFGLYDMSGNINECAFNPVTGGPDILRYYLGGDFSSPSYWAAIESHTISYAYALSVGVRLARNK